VPPQVPGVGGQVQAGAAGRERVESLRQGCRAPPVCEFRETIGYFSQILNIWR